MTIFIGASFNILPRRRPAPSESRRQKTASAWRGRTSPKPNPNRRSPHIHSGSIFSECICRMASQQFPPRWVSFSLRHILCNFKKRVQLNKKETGCPISFIDEMVMLLSRVVPAAGSPQCPVLPELPLCFPE